MAALGLLASGCLLPKLETSKKELEPDASSTGGEGGAPLDEESGGRAGSGTGGGTGVGKTGSGGTALGSGGLPSSGGASNGGVDAGPEAGLDGGGAASGGAGASGGAFATGGTAGSGGSMSSGGAGAGGRGSGGVAGAGGVGGAGGTSCVASPPCNAAGPACTSQSEFVTCTKDGQGCFYQSNPTTCVGGTTCQNGACACPAAKPTTCNSTCVDLKSEALNCGRCGHSCRGSACVNGECQPVTLCSGRTAPWALAVNGSGVYWLETDTVQAVPLSGGNPVTLASNLYTIQPWDIAASASFIYYSNTGPADTTSYHQAVMKVAATGGGNPQIFEQIQNIAAPRNIAVASGQVYWTDSAWDSLYTAPESTGTRKFLYDGSMQGADGPHWAIALDSTNAYTVNGVGGLIRVALSGSDSAFLLGSPGPRAAVSAGINQIATVQGVIYFTTGKWTTPATSTQTNSALYKMPVGGATPTLIVSDLALTPALAADASGVYFDDGNLERLPLDGSPAQRVVTGQKAGFIELDANFIYFTDASSGTVKKVAK